MVSDITSIATRLETEISFILSTNKEEFDQAKKNIDASGQYAQIISGSASYGEAREKSLRIASSLNFNSKETYASSYFSQQISGASLDAYKRCLLALSIPGIQIWLDSQEGDFLFFMARWVGDQGDAEGHYDAEPLVSGAKLIAKPEIWYRGDPEQIILQKNDESDVLLSLRIDGASRTIVLVKEPPQVVMAEEVVSGESVTVQSRNTTKKNCGATTKISCVTPTRPGGYLVVGSGRAQQFDSNMPNKASQTVIVDTSTQICIRFSQSTDACEVKGRLHAAAAALQRYPIVGK